MCGGISQELNDTVIADFDCGISFSAIIAVSYTHLGEEKKQYVIDFLKQKGFKVDEESVSNAIEAAVKQLNTEGLTIE